jgi:dTMP kinase
MSSERKLFIALEGIDGSGKSTQAKLLAEKLVSEGHKVFITCEPTDSPIGSVIRNIMKGRIHADHRTIAGLFVADRLDHLLNSVNGIVKKLNEGYTVITDRFYFSSYAYQGAHTDMDWVIAANAMSVSILKPDVHIFIDVPPALSMQRISGNRASAELYETYENLNKVRAKYLEAFERFTRDERIATVDGNGAYPVIADRIWTIVHNLLNNAA